MFDQDSTNFDHISTSISTSISTNFQPDKVVEIDQKSTIPVDENATGYSIRDMAKMLSIPYGTLNSQLKRASGWGEFRAVCRKTSADKRAKQLYPDSAWMEILVELGHPLPDEMSSCEPVEAELIDDFQRPGEITATTDTQPIEPSFQFDLPDLSLGLAENDDTAITTQTAQYQQYAQTALDQLSQTLSARFATGVQKIMKEQDNALAGLKAKAVGAGAAEAPKSQSSGESSQSS